MCSGPPGGRLERPDERDPRRGVEQAMPKATDLQMIKAEWSTLAELPLALKK